MNDKTPAALDRLLDQVPVGQAPIGDLLTAGHVAKRRQRRTLISGVVAATVLILGGGTIATQALGNGDDDGHTNQSNLTADRTVGEGTHLVGIGEVAVAVPDTWKANNVVCNNPREDAYFFPYPQDCGKNEPDFYIEGGHTWVAITSGEFAETGTRIKGLKPLGEVGRHTVVDGGMSCRNTFPAVCHQVFGVPDLNAYFTLHTDAPNGEQVMSDIRNSLTLLEPNETTVPFVASTREQDVVAALEEAGLTVDRATNPCGPNDSCALGEVTSIFPTFGRVVVTGSTVTVTTFGPS